MTKCPDIVELYLWNLVKWKHLLIPSHNIHGEIELLFSQIYSYNKHETNGTIDEVKTK